MLSAKAKEAQAQLAQAGKSLGSFGHKLVLGTSQLFDQVKEAIQSEMAFDEGGPAGRRVPSRRQLAAGAGAAKYSRWGLRGGAEGRQGLASGGEEGASQASSVELAPLEQGAACRGLPTPPVCCRPGPFPREVPACSPARIRRFEADVSAMQRDSSTYCDEPEDEEDYAAWLAGFDLAARRPDIDALIASNTFMAELQVGALGAGWARAGLGMEWKWRGQRVAVHGEGRAQPVQERGQRAGWRRQSPAGPPLQCRVRPPARLQARIVPLIVEYDAFWTRYFYRLHKLQQKHEQFVQVGCAGGGWHD